MGIFKSVIYQSTMLQDSLKQRFSKIFFKRRLRQTKPSQANRKGVLMLPNALVIGPMKSGTTWIQDYMQSRGDVCLPDRVKETFFFERYWERGTGWYSGFFQYANSQEKPLCLEVAPSYFHNPDVPRRVQEALGDVPLLVTLRDPIKRAWSHYLHLRHRGDTRASLQEAVAQHPQIIEASRYRACLERWYAVFPKGRIHIVWQDLLKESPDDYARQVCNALALEPRPVPKTLKGRSNEAAVPSSYWLAMAGSAVARSLRHGGLYNIVNGAKQLGLKRLFFGNPGSASGIEPTTQELVWLRERLADEIPPEAETVRHA
jgi:hypothetical protein